MTYTVTYGPDGQQRTFDSKETAIEFLRRKPITVAGEVRDENGKQWAVRQGRMIR